MRTIGTMTAVWLLSAVLTSGQAGQEQRPPMAEDVFKNVQILKGIPVDQFMGTMGFFAAATGLNCTDCHVDESGGNWAKYADDNDLKRTTRRMMRMVSSIKLFGQLAPAVIPTVIFPRGSQSNVSTSSCLCWS